MRKALPAILVWTVLVASCEAVVYLSNDRAVTLPEGTGSLARTFGILAMQVVGVAWIIGLALLPLFGWLARRQPPVVRGVAAAGACVLALFAALFVVQVVYTLDPN